jgi:hypothetical protein
VVATVGHLAQNQGMSWTPVDEKAGLWSATYRVPGFQCQSSALKLASGGFLVLSPGPGLSDEFAQQMGKAEILLAPNSYHHMGLSTWRKSFPEALIAADTRAHPRLQKQGHQGLENLETLKSMLPSHASLLVPPGTRIGEVWLRVQGDAGVTWCVGDAFFNHPRMAKRWKMRQVQRLLKAAPGLSMSGLMKWGGLKDRAGFKRWALEQLEKDQPQTLVVLHGDMLQDRVTEQIRELLRRRL